MIIASWNINSIRIRLDSINNWISKRQPNIILFQEIKCENDSFPYNFFENIGYHCEVNGEKGRNGVAIIIKKDLLNQNDSIFTKDLNNSGQSRLIAIDFKIKNLVLICVYVPNGNPVDNKEKFDQKILWYDELINFVKPLLVDEKKILIGGDFNVLENIDDVKDFDNWRNDALGHKLVISKFRKVLSLGLTNIVRIFHNPGKFYSYWGYQDSAWARNYGLLIDHFLASPQIIENTRDFGIDSYVRSWERPSDHVPIWINLN